MQTVQDLTARARSMLAQSTLYWLGFGGNHPNAASAAEACAVGLIWPTLPPEERAELLPLAQAAGIEVHNPSLVMPACDCSGYVCWALRFSRKVRPAAYTSPDGWISTDSIWNDAMEHGERFLQIPQAVPGCLVVYPKPERGESHGHVGIVTCVGPAGQAATVIHCSAGNFRSAPWDSVKETAADVFAAQPKSIYVWCRTVLRE